MLKPRHFAAMLSSLLFLSIPLHANEIQGSGGENSNGWSERGVFVFGSLPIDFEAGYLRFGRGLVEVKDCSTDDYYCMSSSQLSVVLPRKCSQWEGTDVVASHAVTTMTVLKSENSSANQIARNKLNGEVRLLLTEGGNPFLFLYDRTLGVKSIFRWTATEPTLEKIGSYLGEEPFKKLQQMIRSNEIEMYRLSTFDPFGQCKS